MKKNKLLSLIFSRFFVFAVALVLQVAWFVLGVVALGDYNELANLFLTILSLLVVIYIINGHSKLSTKMAWIVTILVFPLIGGIVFLISGGKAPKRKLARAINGQLVRSHSYDHDCTEILDAIGDDHLRGQCNYLVRQNFPVYDGTETKYYPLGDDAFQDMLDALESAEHFIFMEYFIVTPGRMWNTIRAILERKAAEGVDVRFLYDDVGCLSAGYDKQLREKGIKSIAFNPFIPLYSTIMNNRDHRKILVVDGNTAFTGGINLADEYINDYAKYGHWKDSVIRLRGEAVWSMTRMFLEMWNALEPTDNDFAPFQPTHSMPSDGFVQPYTDSPLDHEYIGESVYLNMINNAKRYAYVMTPYLIIDEEMNTALKLAAKRGVDVRIITPGIPDKKMVWDLTRAHYPDLLQGGVRIYEYTPGFLHSKNVLVDGEVGVVGSINMDYRSLTLHFENACLMIGTKSVEQEYQDFMDTFQKSQEISQEQIAHSKKRAAGLLHSIYYALLRLLAPLL